jgi:flagellar basal body-associated protein FliL
MAADPNGEDKKQLKKPAGTGRRAGVIILVVILGGIVFWYWSSRSESSASANPSTRVQSALHLETFVLNLADKDQRSYLRVGIDLGLNREPKRDEPVPVAKVRDTILGALAEAKVDALMTPEGKAKLKENLLHTLQERLPDQGIVEVYFTEFLIQR